jgi:hypothetical protein
MIDKLSIICFIGFIIGALVCAYFKGYYTCSVEYETKLLKLQNENRANIMDIEFKMQEKQNKLLTDYINQIGDLEMEYRDDLAKITTDKLSDTTNCVSDTNTSNPRMSKETSNKSNTICYTETELLSKIKSSLDIAKECDELALKYNTLLNTCKD